MSAAPAPRPRVERLAAGTILNATQASKKSLNAAVGETIAQAAAEISDRQRNDRVRKAELMAALLLLSKGMATKATAAIFASRQHARREGARRSIAELAALGVMVGPAASSLMMAASLTRADEDNAHAHSAGESLAVAWRGMALYSLSAATRKEEDASKAIALTNRPMLKRVERTAETETAQAYSSEHREAIAEEIERDSELRLRVDAVRAVRRWSAFLEACPVCAEHDGEEVGIGESFEGGDEPGFVHPRCRCYECILESYESMSLAS